MRRGAIKPLVWPGTLLAVGTGLVLLAEGLAHIDGLRSYGQVGGMGEIVAVIGGAWLIVVLVRLLFDRARPRR